MPSPRPALLATLMRAAGASGRTLASKAHCTRFYSHNRGTTIVMLMTKGRGPAKPNTSKKKENNKL